jgi:hypothetical protein
MTSHQDEPTETDQDSEPTMTAPFEGRPDGIEDESVAETQPGASSPDADDQTGAESPGGS